LILAISFPTANARWQMDGSEDADFHLVYYIRKHK